MAKVKKGVSTRMDIDGRTQAIKGGVKPALGQKIDIYLQIFCPAASLKKAVNGGKDCDYWVRKNKKPHEQPNYPYQNLPLNQMPQARKEQRCKGCKDFYH
jgi:hypothetical protein